jgi:hypothetical protein
MTPLSCPVDQQGDARSQAFGCIPSRLPPARWRRAVMIKGNDKTP